MKILPTAISTTTLALIVFLLFAGYIMADNQSVEATGTAKIAKDQSNTAEIHAPMKIRVMANSKTTVFELNNSQAANELYAQLPLSIKVENYSDNEKIFYPPRKLNTGDAPQANARAGTLAYYAPWGDVVMFYDSFGSAPGLFELGQAVSGKEHINTMSGRIRIEKGPGP